MRGSKSFPIGYVVSEQLSRGDRIQSLPHLHAVFRHRRKSKHKGLKPNGHHSSQMRSVNGVKLANAVIQLVFLHGFQGHSSHNAAHAHADENALLVALSMCVGESDDMSKQG